MRGCRVKELRGGGFVFSPKESLGGVEAIGSEKVKGKWVLT
jgi:hypothetical protein